MTRRQKHAHRRNRTRRRRHVGGGKATLNESLQPANPYEKGTLERTLFGMVVNIFYYARGPFPNDSANESGYVPLTRILSTGKFRSFIRNHPDINIVEKVLEVVKDAFDIKYTESGPMIAAKAWPKVNKDFL